MADLVVLSLERWDEVWRRNQYLVDGLLRLDPELRVLFVEPADDPLHDLTSGRRPSAGAAPSMIADRLWRFRPVKWLPRRLDAGADARLARSTRRAAASLGMTAPTLWINDPASVELAQLTGWPVLYDMTDDWTVADRPAAERERIVLGEAWLLAHAESVVACSPELVRRKEAHRSDIALVRNGVDVARYRTPAPRPRDLPEGDYALYAGTLHRDRIDVELVANTAQRLRGQTQVVLLGPEAWSAADSGLVREAGVVVLGARSHDQVPGYLQHAGVLIVPHVVTDFTESLDPLKLYEYAATGRPIVSTDVAGFRDASNVSIATREAFPETVRQAFTTVPPHPQGMEALVLDWSSRVRDFRRCLPVVSD